MAKTLLLADDSVTIQKVVNISFASEDVTLVTVDNGDDAVTRAREVRPDLILADVVMPGKSGYEVCEAIKADPDLAHIPVLLLTGTFESFDEERASRVGAAGHVAKPFEAQSLVSRVKQLLAAPPAPAPPPVPAITDTPPIVPPDAVTAPRDNPSDSGDSFDFFDDDLADLAPAPEADDLGPEDTDSAFAFVGDEMAANAAGQRDARAAAAPPPDHTVAMIADEPQGDPLAGPSAGPGPAAPRAVADLDAFDIDPSGSAGAPGPGRIAPAEAAEDSFSPMVPAGVDDEAFDFTRDDDDLAIDEPGAPDTVLDDGLMSVGVGDVAQATVLDPNGASGYDVSSSDLGMSLLDDETLDPARPVDAAAATPAWEASVDLAEADEPAAEIVEPAALGDDHAPAHAGSPFDDLDADEAEPLDLADAPAAAVFDDSYAPAAASFGDTGAPAARRPLPADAAASADSVLAEIAPALREQVHDTLEKMAWESFGAVTEKIVTETVDRVEKIAWEVIPQLAEALIKAEIRRLKGESED